VLLIKLEMLYISDKNYCIRHNGEVNKKISTASRVAEVVEIDRGE
jgi:hypothetical protein